MDDSSSLAKVDVNEPAKRRRWRLRLRLRTLMVLILIIGVWSGWQLKRAREIRIAVATIEKRGSVGLETPFDPGLGQWKSWIHPPGWLYSALGEGYFATSSMVGLGNHSDRPSTGELIHALGVLPCVKILHVHGTPLVDGDMESISRLSQLESLAIDYADEPLLPPLLQKKGPRQDVHVAPDLTIAGLRGLGRATRLQSILISRKCRVDASVLQAWSKLPSLNALCIYVDMLDEDAMRALGKFDHLKSFELTRDEETPDDGLRRPLPIGSWSEVEYLEIHGFKLTSMELTTLGRCPHLRKLVLISCGISDSQLGILRHMAQLRTLVLSTESCSRSALSTLQDALATADVLTW